MSRSIFMQDISLDRIDGLVVISRKFLSSFEIGELFIEKSKQSSWSLKNGYLDNMQVNCAEGFCLRGVKDGTQFYVSRDSLDNHALNTAIQQIKQYINSNVKYEISDPVPGFVTGNLYPNTIYKEDININEYNIALLYKIYEYLKEQSVYFKQINVSLSMSEQIVWILTNDGRLIHDIRPHFRLFMNIVINKNNKEDNFFKTISKRYFVEDFETLWKESADELVKQAHTMIDADQAPCGNFPILFGSGAPGILLHEAIGHGLEGDFSRKNLSVFSNKVGQKVATECVTIIDDGTIPNYRGSINFDDEGTMGQKNILVEDGILMKYMTDKLNGQSLGYCTGNGRRTNFKHLPIPRMTNTFMQPGSHTLNELMNYHEPFIYAVDFAFGQVNITSGQFAFKGSESYLIKNGEKTPIKGCVFSGLGEKVLQNVISVGNNLQFSSGTCGKNGQYVPVTDGIPPVFIKEMSISGS